jgi:hypothetical protein
MEVILGHFCHFIGYVQKGGRKMPQFLYKPFTKSHTLPQDKLEEISHVINNNWDVLNLKPHQFLSLGKFILLSNNRREIAEQVSLLLKEQSKKNQPKISEEIQSTVGRLKIVHDLTQKQINQLIRETKKKEIKKLELEQQIEHLKKQASILGDDRRRQRIKDQFNKAYNKFFTALNSDLYTLDSSDRQEITSKLEAMCGGINDTLDGLK